MQLTHSLKAPGFNPCTYHVRNWWFQHLLSKFDLHRYTGGKPCAWHVMVGLVGQTFSQFLVLLQSTHQFIPASTGHVTNLRCNAPGSE
jgi:hypothetical protein